MANSITVVNEKFIPLLDQIYQREVKSSVLERNELVRSFDGSNSVSILNVTTQALGDYSRATGYVSGNITATWEKHTLSIDRGRIFNLDSMDNEETLGLTLGASMEDFMQRQVSGEVDAYRFAKLAGLAGTTVSANLDATSAKTAMDTAITSMKNARVPLSGAYAFVTPEMLNFLENSSFYTYNVNAEATGARDGMIRRYRGLEIIEVPQDQFYSQINLYDGTTSGEEAGGYIKTPSTGRDINFMIVARGAALPVTKHNPSNIISPDANQTADAYIMKYRMYHDIFVPVNKTPGIYLHTKTS